MSLGQAVVNHEYVIGDHILPSVNVMKDLGVHISKDLKFSQHCSKIASSAYYVTSLIFRNFEYKSPDLLLKLYIVFVRPKVEYATCIWSPSLKRDIDIVERVQRKFTKRISGLENFTYLERLEKLKLEPLEYRRLKNDLYMCFSIVKNHSVLNFSDFFRFSSSKNTRSYFFNSWKLEGKIPKKSVGLNVFHERVINIWNSLPNDVVNSTSLTVFKTKLNSTLDYKYFRQFLKGSAFEDLH